MDLNELLQAHQIAAMGARPDDSNAEQQRRYDVIAQYARRIHLWRLNAGVPASAAPVVEGERAPRSNRAEL